METLLHDVRYGSRQLVKHPVFTILAVVSLALRIGANTAIFSLVNIVLLRPLPVKEPSQLIEVYSADPSCPRKIRRQAHIRLSF